MPKGRKNCKSCNAEIPSVSRVCSKCGVDCKTAKLKRAVVGPVVLLPVAKFSDVVLIPKSVAPTPSLLDLGPIQKSDVVFTEREQVDLARLIYKRFRSDYIRAVKVFRHIVGIECSSAEFMKLVVSRRCTAYCTGQCGIAAHFVHDGIVPTAETSPTHLELYTEFMKTFAYG